VGIGVLSIMTKYVYVEVLFVPCMDFPIFQIAVAQYLKEII
jgi:hypothetical protein